MLIISICFDGYTDEKLMTKRLGLRSEFVDFLTYLGNGVDLTITV